MKGGTRIKKKKWRNEEDSYFIQLLRDLVIEWKKKKRVKNNEPFSVIFEHFFTFFTFFTCLEIIIAGYN